MSNEEARSKQKRGAVIAMTADELDDYLRTERTCRLATVSKDGTPHVTALWFAWDGEYMWINSVTKSRRWADWSQRPAVSALVDSGESYDELRGVELMGDMEIVGDDIDTTKAGQIFVDKYRGGGTFSQDRWHGWARLKPTKIVSWDFRKLPPAKQKPGQ